MNALLKAAKLSLLCLYIIVQSVTIAWIMYFLFNLNPINMSMYLLVFSGVLARAQLISINHDNNKRRRKR